MYSRPSPCFAVCQVEPPKCVGCVQVCLVYEHGGAAPSERVSPHRKNRESADAASLRCWVVTGLIHGQRVEIGTTGNCNCVRLSLLAAETVSPFSSTAGGPPGPMKATRDSFLDSSPATS